MTAVGLWFGTPHINLQVQIVNNLTTLHVVLPCMLELDTIATVGGAAHGPSTFLHFSRLFFPDV